MPFVTASDVAQLHATIDEQQMALDQSVTSCIKAGTLDGSGSLAGDWHRFTARVALYLDDAPSNLRAASQMDTGQQLQRDMHPFYGRLSAAGCSPPPEPAPPPAPQDLFGSAKDILSLVFAVMVLSEFRR